MDRPTGVTILAILAFLNGLLAILGAITVMYLGIGTGLESSEYSYWLWEYYR
jgi:hypothetical protein